MLVVPEDGDVGRVDHGVAVALMSFPTVISVHRGILDRQVEGAGATEVFLLGTGTREEAASRIGGRGEVERDHIVSFSEVALVGGEGGLVGHLIGRRMRTRGRARMRVVGGIVDGCLHACFHSGGDIDRPGWTDVLPSLGNGDRFFAQLHGEVTIDAWFEKAHGMTRLSSMTRWFASDY